MSSFIEAERRSMGDSLSVEERIRWSARAGKAALGLDPDKIYGLDHTAFFMKKIKSIETEIWLKRQKDT